MFMATNGPAPARGRAVDQAGDHLLAGAGLAPDEHVGVGVGDLVDAFEHQPHGRVVADEGGPLGAVGRGWPRCISSMTRPRRLLEGAQVKGLGQEVRGTQPQGRDRVPHGPVPGQDDDRHRRPALAGRLQHREAVAGCGQLQVGDADVDVVLLAGARWPARRRRR